MKKSKKVNKNSNNGVQSRIAIISGILALYFTYMSVDQPKFEAGTQRYVYENIGTTFLVMAIVFGLWSVKSQAYAYWPFLSKSNRKKLDERQTNVRQRVFEMAYRRLAIISIITLLLLDFSDKRMRSVMIWLFSAAFLLLPSVIAATQKDS